MSSGVLAATAPGLPARGARLGRSELLLWLMGGGIAGELLLVFDVSSWAALEDNLSRQNYIFWFACWVVLKLLAESDRERPICNRDLALATAASILLLVSSLVTYRFGFGGLATLLGCFLLVQHEGDRNLKAAGTVVLAIAVHHLWGPILFRLLTPEFLKADALIVGAIYHLLRPDIVWTGTMFRVPGGHATMMIGACSSFHNISTALLACASCTMLMRRHWLRHDLRVVAVAVVAMVAINATRVVGAGWSTRAYELWHGETAALVLSQVQTLIIALIAYWGATAGGRTP